MEIKDFIQSKIDSGVTINRLSKILKVSYPALRDHYEGNAQSVNSRLAKSIYKNFGIVLNGYLEIELKG